MMDLSFLIPILELASKEAHNILVKQMNTNPEAIEALYSGCGV